MSRNATSRKAAPCRAALLSPRVSIGLPVRNGERYLEAALDSLLAQTFTDFELVISDNASTDATQAICRAYAARDARIRYSRLEKDIGGFPNHNRVVALSVGEYFTWAACDDLRAPDHLARCVAVLEQDPGVVLCFSRVQEIDERGDLLPERPFLANVESKDPCERWRSLVLGDWVYDPIYGVIRSDVLRRTGLLKVYADSDRVLLGELALSGRFHRLEGTALFFRRIHPGQSTRAFPTRRARVAWFAPDRVGAVTLPIVRETLDWFRVIATVPLPWRVRMRATWTAVRWALDYRHTMRRELDFAARAIAKKLFRRPSPSPRSAAP